MRAVMPVVPPHILAWRKETGADRWDEMWEGVLHMPPAPNRDHQRLQVELVAWLMDRWERPHGNTVHSQVNLASVGGWPHDYRIPDLLLLTPDCPAIDRNDYIEGPPAAVIEIRSPGDETREKLPFYARLGAGEVWIIDRDTRNVELHVSDQDAYRALSPASDGWLESPATGIRLRTGAESKLLVQLGDDDGTRRALPKG